MSHSPGIRKPPAAVDQGRIVRYPDMSAGPTAVMRLPAMRTVCLSRRDPSITSTTVTAWMATVGAPVARLGDRHARRPRPRAGGEQQACETQQDLHDSQSPNAAQRGVLVKALAPAQVDRRAACKIVGQYELARFLVASLPHADEAQVF